MMTPVIFDMRTITEQEPSDVEGPQGFLDKLMESLRSLPSPSDAHLADEMLDRARPYVDDQPSFAADLLASVGAEEMA